MKLLDPNGVPISVSDELGARLITQGFTSRETTSQEVVSPAPARKPRAPRKTDTD